MGAAQSALRLQHVSKVFQGQWALDDVDLELRAGEVHALLGPNGCGKSTLIKILAGYHAAEPGAQAHLFDEPLDLGSRTKAHPIRFIHQDLGLVGALDSVDNLALGGAGYARRWWLSDRVERRHATRRLEALGVSVDVAAPVDSLPQAVQTMLALVRAVDAGLGDEGLLVLDEPTAALPAHEVDVLFDLVREYKRRGGTILYVTHRLSEVFALADRVTVMRDGQRVATRDVADLDHDSLVRLIVGRELQELSESTAETDGAGASLLTVSGLAGGTVDGVDLAVPAGEITGLTGLVGSGYEEVLRLIFDGSDRAGGQVTVGQDIVPPQGPRASIAAGVAYASSDRKRLSAIASWSLRENVTLPALKATGRFGWMTERAEARDAASWMRRLDVVPDRPSAQFDSLSGGNQQKVVLARWLRSGARVFLLEEPTNGVDVGAKLAIYEALRATVADGSAVVLTSQDPEELLRVCDRVIVLRDGRIGAVLTGDQLTPERIVSESLRKTTTATPGSRTP